MDDRWADVGLISKFKPLKAGKTSPGVGWAEAIRTNDVAHSSRQLGEG